MDSGPGANQFLTEEANSMAVPKQDFLNFAALKK